MQDVDLLYQSSATNNHFAEEEINFEIVVNKKSLLTALAHTQNIVERKNLLPILSNVKLEAANNEVTIVATDLDLQIFEKIPAEIFHSGSLSIPAHIFYDIVRKLSDDSAIRLTANTNTKNNIIIESENCRFELPYLNAEDFPKMCYSDFTHIFKLPFCKLQDIIDKNRFSMSSEEARHNLNGIYLHVKEINNKKLLRGVSTDGHRLSYMDIEMPDDFVNIPGIVIPRKTVLELSKIIEDSKSDVEISLLENMVKFSFGSIELISKLIESNFPAYEILIPIDNNDWIRSDKTAFSTAVDRVSTIAFERARAVKLIISGNSLQLHASAEENLSYAKETILIESECKDLQIGFSSRYILEALSTIKGNMVELRFLDSFSPIIIKEMGNDSYCHVIMPMRV